MEVAGEGVVSGGPFRVLIAHDMKDSSEVPKRELLEAMAIALANVSFLASNIAAGERSFEEIGSIEDSSAAVAVACSAYLGLKVGLQDFFN